MLKGREAELDFLNSYYDRVGSQVLVIYGQKGVGKTTLIEEFLGGKNCLYYEAVPCSTRQQLFYLGQHLRDLGISAREYPSFDEIFSLFRSETIHKSVLVIDEFHNFVKTDTEFFERLGAFLEKQKNHSSLFVILSSSSVCWVENSMREKMGEYSRMVTALYRVKELKYRDFAQYFSGFSKYDSIAAYAVLGGVPGLWQFFNDDFSLRDNIEGFILQSNEKLYDYGQRIVEEELRETAVYNTILCSLAQHKNKLNELHLHTGFSRAKISVYLKNLIQLGIVEKVESTRTEGRENTRKGVYRISNAYVHFYYRFLFPNQNRLTTMEAEDFFERCIQPFFRDYVSGCFVTVCKEFLERENELQRLPFEYTKTGQWFGKTGDIDFMLEDEGGNILAGICNWGKDTMTFEDYQWFLYNQEQAKIRAEYMVLFSVADFDSGLRKEALRNPKLTLLTMDQMGIY